MESNLRLLRKELNITQDVLADILGIGKSGLSMIETGKTRLSDRNKKILVQKLNVNPRWFDNRRAGMFLGESPNIEKINDPKEVYHNVPVHQIKGAYGLADILGGREESGEAEYLRIPGLSLCDGAVRVMGDSLYPVINSGDIVIYKILEDASDIFWGEMYLLSVDMKGEEYATVKYVIKSDEPGHIRLTAKNDQYPDKDIPVSRILGIAMVRASIRFNSMK